MTNLLFSHADIVTSSTAYNEPGAETYYAASQAYGGDRTRRYRASAAATSKTFSFDLGSGVTQEPDHVIVSRIGATVARDTGTTAIRVKGSSASDFSTGYNNAANVTTLYGPQSADYYRAISPGAAYRYWQVGIETTDSVIIEAGKIHVGNWFDIGRDPLASSPISRGPLGAYSRRAAFAWEIRYDGITDAKREAFQQAFIERPENGFFLYDTSASRPLLGNTLLHVRLVNVRQSQISVNKNSIIMTIEELI